MSMYDMDENLIKLSQNCYFYEEQYKDLSREIDDLLSEKVTMEYKVTDTQMLLRATIDKMLDSDTFVFSREKFIDMFIKASYFCIRNNRLSEFSFVHITETQLQASNKKMLITTKCSCIPGAVKNKKIFWNVRDLFEDHAARDIECPNFDAVIPSVDNYHLFPRITRANFRYHFDCHVRNNNMITVNFAGIEPTYNKEYLSTCLWAMGCDSFDVYVKGVCDPLLMRNSDTTILLMPLKMPD